MDNGSVYIRIHDLFMGAFTEIKMELDMESYLSDESWQWDEEDSENESKDSRPQSGTPLGSEKLFVTFCNS